jgi:hypothetical protein
MWDFFRAGRGAVGQFVQPSNIETWPQQDAFTVLAHFDEGLVVLPDQGAQRQARSTWLLQATWDGAAAAAAIFSPPAVANLSGFDQVVLPGWHEVVPLVGRLGGYGPAQLTVGVYAAQVPADGDDELDLQHAVEAATALDRPEAPVPPRHTLYSRLPEHTWVRRWVSVAEPSSDMLGSLQREVQRAAGSESWEPEDVPRS